MTKTKKPRTTPRPEPAPSAAPSYGKPVLETIHPEPNIGAVGRDAPDYTHLANAFVARHALAQKLGEEIRDLALDLRHELRTAYRQGQNDRIKDDVDVELETP